MSLILLAMLASCNINPPDTDTEEGTDSQIIDTSTDNQQKNIETITDFPALAGMQENAEKIKITYYVKGEYKELTVTNEQDISSIMKSLLECEIKEVGKEIPPGSGYFRLDITSGGKEFIISQCMLYGESYYELLGDIGEVLDNLVFPPNEYVVNGWPNSMNTTRIDKRAYYEPIKLGSYIGESVPSDENNGHGFNNGLYYEVVGDYEKAITLFSDTSAINEQLFEDYYIFVIGMHIETGLPYDVFGFYDLYFDYDLGIAKIQFDGRSGFDVTEACSVHNYYLKIPKGDYYRYVWQERSTGKLDWNFNEDEYHDYWSSYEITAEHTLENGTSFILTTAEEIKELGDYYGIKTLSHWNKDNYLLLVYMNYPCYSCFVGFKDFHTDGENVYVTIEKNGCEYSHSEKYALIGIEIPKGKVPIEIQPCSRVIVLIEQNEKQYIK